MRITREEQETICTFNELDKAADIETLNARLIRDIRRAAEAYPEDVQVTEGADGAVRAIFPKKRLKIRMPRVMTEEQRAEIAERFKRTNTSNQ